MECKVELYYGFNPAWRGLEQCEIVMATDKSEAIKRARLRRAAINLLGEWRPECLSLDEEQ